MASRITEEGTILCTSPNPDSLHEFDVENGRVLYRQIRPDGSRLNGDLSNWMTLSAKQTSLHYHNGPKGLRDWFHNHGFTRERVDAMQEAEQAKKPVKRRR